MQSRMVSETHYFGEKDLTSQEHYSDAARRLTIEGEKYAEDFFKTVAEAASDQGMSMSRTPPQKPRRKKHRPKVVSEGKPRRTTKPKAPKIAGTEGETRVKRKYVRRKGIEKPHPNLPTEVTTDSGRQNKDEPSKKSCRRALNFDSEQPTNETMAGQGACAAELKVQDIQTQTEQLKADDQLPQGFEVKVGGGPEGITHALNQTMNATLSENALFQESQDPSKTPPAQTSFQQDILGVHCSAVSMPGRNQHDTHGAPDNVDMQMLTSQNKTYVCEGEQPAELKRRCYDPREQIPSRYMNILGIQFNSLQAYESISWLHFPNIHKKKRTEKGQVPTSALSSFTNGKLVKRLGIRSSPNAETTNILSLTVDHAATPCENGTGSQDKQQAAGCVLPFPQTERPAKKRSRGLTRVRDSASLSRLMECCMMPTCPPQQSATADNSQNTHTSMQALLMEMNANLSRKKRTKRVPLVNSAYPRTLALQLNGSVLMHQNHHGASAQTPGICKI